MEGVTLGIALLGALFVLFCRPVLGLCAYLAVMLLYPDYLRISVGTIDISAGRIVVTVLLLRCMLDSSTRKHFRWGTLDKLIVVSVVVDGATLLCTTPFEVWLENRCGSAIDTLFAYMAVRLVISDRASLVTVAKALAFMTLALAIHAVVECLTGWSLYAGLGKYCPWAPGKGAAYQVRYGLNRAEGPSAETIMFGLTFVTVLPIIWLLRHQERPWKWLSYPLTASAVFGAAATISSGPYVSLALVISCLALERAKYLVRPALALLILACVTAEIISNRHFYDVVDRLTFNTATAWYRSELFEIAVKKLPDYWTVGYGLIDPGWGPLIDGRNATDGVNDYVMHTVRHGLPGLLCFLAVLVAAGHRAAFAHKTTTDPWVRSCAWSLGSTLFSLAVAFFTVSLFTHMVSLFYVLLAMHGALDAPFGNGQHRTRPGSPWPKGPANVRRHCA